MGIKHGKIWKKIGKIGKHMEEYGTNIYIYGQIYGNINGIS